jgi:photosystem II stability/assembly factor-like uncharacterized protein
MHRQIFILGLIYSLLLFSESIKGANIDQVDFTQAQLDSQVKDIMWCGSGNEAILVLTDTGMLHRSRDRGQTWKKMQSYLGKSAQSVLDDG